MDIVAQLPCVPLPGDVVEVLYRSSKKGEEWRWVKVLVVRCLLPTAINGAGKRYHGFRGIMFEVQHLDMCGTRKKKKLLTLKDYPTKWRFPHDLSEVWIDGINGNTDLELKGKKKPYEEVLKSYYAELKRSTFWFGKLNIKNTSVVTRRLRRIENWLNSHK